MMYTGAVRLAWCVQMPCVACEASVECTDAMCSL